MQDAPNRSNRTIRDYIGIFARGYCMGVADVIPGVSGGTMAFILGVYEELLDAVHSINGRLLKKLLTLRLREAMADFPYRFLIALVGGIFLAIFSLAQFFSWALTHHPEIVWAFFFGLVLASIIAVRGKVTKWSARTAVMLFAAALFAFVLVGVVPVETPTASWFVFLSGSIAICAMILPGISGSFILVVLGKYQYMLESVVQRDFLPIFIFGAGGIVGLVFFVRILKWLYNRYHDLTVAALIGLMIGSMRKIWPWKETVESITDQRGVVQHNVLPDSLAGETILAVSIGLFGFFLVLVIERLAHRRSTVETEN